MRDTRCEGVESGDVMECSAWVSDRSQECSAHTHTEVHTCNKHNDQWIPQFNILACPPLPSPPLLTWRQHGLVVIVLSEH